MLQTSMTMYLLREQSTIPPSLSLCRVLRETERYMSYQSTLEHVGKASDDLVIFDSLLTMAERVTKLVLFLSFYNSRWTRGITT